MSGQTQSAGTERAEPTATQTRNGADGGADHSSRARSSRAAAAERAAAQNTAAEPAVVERTVEPLLEPRDGLPPLVETADALRAAIEALAKGTGAVAVDAERASGFRYGHRAFLVQFRRQGAGTVLIDPVACPDLSELDAALAERRGCAACSIARPAVPG